MTDPNHRDVIDELIADIRKQDAVKVRIALSRFDEKDVQDDISLRKLNEAIRSADSRLRNFAKEALLRVGRKSVPLLVQNLLIDDPDTRIHSLNLLGQIGDLGAIAPIRKLLNTTPNNPNVRFAAYEALGRLPLIHGAFALAGGLLDPEAHVRIAAARAIDINFNEILKAGIKNMVKMGDDDSRKVVETIIDARADVIFLELAPEEGFRSLAREHLPRVHEDIQRHFKELLQEKGFDCFANDIVVDEKKPTRGAIVCAVDDSRMMLSIYKNTLHELGYESILFEFPDGVVEWLEKEKADILLIDLNMPKITGVELTEKIREKYTSEELPIIMVTSQIEFLDHDAAHMAGVNEIMRKPFTAGILKEAIERSLKRKIGKTGNR